MVREDRPRLILAIGADALARVQKIKGIPILYLMVLNPQTSRHRKGTSPVSAMTRPAGKYFDLLARISPAPKKIGLIYDPAKTGHLVKRAQQAAQDPREWSLRFWKSRDQMMSRRPSIPLKGWSMPC